MTITESSPWRTTGAVPWNTFANELMIAQSPMIDEAREIWEAAGDLSRLMLAMSWVEQKHGTWTASPIPARYHNPLSLKAVVDPKTGDRPWMTFSNYTQGVRAWRDRITSDSYGDGVYARTVSVADLIRVYAPPNDNNTERYIADVVAIINRLPCLAAKETSMAITFGRVAKPTIIDMIVAKPYDGAGFNYVQPRRCLGVCTHITDGDPPGTTDLEWYAEFFGIGGERQYDALTDLGIDRAGKIAMWNDPFGNRSPWASGGSDGLEGDGPAFVRTLGIGAINGSIASVENVGKSPAKLTDAQLESNAQFMAWIFDGANNHPHGTKVPWSSFPLNPTAGCVTHMLHLEFATKACPGPGIVGQIDALQDRTRAIMKAAQEGESQPSIPPPDPVENPGKQYPDGMNRAKANRLFGTLVRHNTDGTDTGYGFDENGAISNAWLERGATEGKYPKADEWWPLVNSNGTVRQVVTFRDGWALAHLADRRGWIWL